MQTILGAGGAIGTPLAKALRSYTTHVRLVGRNPKKVNPEDELFKADLSDEAQVVKALEGSEVAYLVVGLEYKYKVWQTKWPRIMENVIKGCKANGCKLVFFDNIYMYDPAHLNGMTEETPFNPSSRKGAVRMAIANMLLDEIAKGDLQALIARSADFYGPGVKQVSVLSQTILENIAAGKKAQVFGDPDKLHSYTYTPDAAAATARLGNTPDAYQQTWHLPTAPDPWTPRQWADRFAQELGKESNISTMGQGLMNFLGIFIPILKELGEMNYQNTTDYVFDSSKYTTAFGESATNYEDGMKAIIAADYR